MSYSFHDDYLRHQNVQTDQTYPSRKRFIIQNGNDFEKILDLMETDEPP